MFGARATAVLPLHPGKAPHWLFGRMVSLAKCISAIMVDEYGTLGYMERLSDPWFFQSLSCVLGYDWHSSGTTTVTCGALKEAMNPQELGMAFAGGKGKTSKKTPDEIKQLGDVFGFTYDKVSKLTYASRMSAKVDNSLVQDGYQLYHHCFVVDEEGHWAIIQQGINHERADARRYHWAPGENNFIENPHSSIICNTHLTRVLNMTSRESDRNRSACVDLVCENTERLRRMALKPLPENQSRLDAWTAAHQQELVMPRGINWDTLRAVYEYQPKGYEELVAFKGVGPSTIRGLSLIAELVYGEKASWKDPVRFSFAFGGKDGVPFPVDRNSMDEAVDLLRNGVSSANVKDDEKRRALARLRRCVPQIPDWRRRLN